MNPAFAVVIVSHQSASVLGPTLAALADQLTSHDEVVVVDCASRDDPRSVAARALPRARMLELGENLGFAGGASAGAAATRAELLFFLNPDAVPEPGCLDALRATAQQRPDWGAWQALVLQGDGQRVNSRGNVAHWTGLGWAGGHDEPVPALAGSFEAGFASGAAMVVRRTAWEAAGGFDPAYFMYGEDLDLCLRLRLAGLGIGVEPGARVRHDYEFAKGDYKWFHLERNRAWTVLSTYPAPLLLLAAPGLLALELALLGVACLQGWLPAKLRAQAAVLRSARTILGRRRRVQATRRVGAREFAVRLEATLDSQFLGPVARNRAAAGLQRRYWRLVMRALGAG